VRVRGADAGHDAAEQDGQGRRQASPGKSSMSPEGATTLSMTTLGIMPC
jgi:hypothetical protein